MRLSSAHCESGLYSAPSKPRATYISPWCPTSQGQGITSSGCQMLQLRQTAAVSATGKHQQQVTAAPCLAQQGLQEVAAQRNPDSSVLSGAHSTWRASYKSTHSNPSARSHGTRAEPAVLQQQQQQFAAELLERAAAAPRPSAPPPDRLTASSSNSSDHSSSQRHRQLPRDRSRPRLSPATAVVAAAAEPTYAADAGVAAGMLGPLGSSAAEARGSKGRPPHKGGSSQRSAAAGAGSSRLSDTDWLLMQRIRQHCHSWEDVAALYEGAAADQFTAQHCAAALYHLAVLWKQGLKQVPRHTQQFVHASKLQQQLYQMQQLAGALLRAMCSRMQEASLRDIADAWYAAEVLSLLQGPRAAADHTAAAAASSSAPASSSSSVGAAASAGGGALIASGQATFVAVSLQHSSRLLRQPLLQLRSLSRLLTSLAHLGIKPDHDWWAAVLDAAAGVMEQLLQEPQHATAHGHKGRGSPSSTSRSRRGGRHSESCAADHANAQAVALLGWAVAVLRAPASPAWWRLFHQASAQLMPVMSASHLSNCMYTCALARQTPDAAWMEAFYACSSKCWPWYMPVGFASTLWSLAALQQQPPLQWLSEFDAASAALLHRFPLRHIGMCLWGLARIQSRQQAAGTALPGQPHILPPPPPPQQQQVQFPSLAWQDQAWAQLSRSGELSADAAQSLSCILWGSVRLGLSVPQARLQELEALSLEVTRSMTPQALAITTWGLGILRGRATNRRFIKRLRSRCIQAPELLQQLPPQGLCMLLCGLARMDAWQPQGFKQQLLAAVTACVEPPKQPTAKQQRKRRTQQDQGNSLDSDSSSSSSSSQSQVLPATSLPLVLLQLRQLRVQVPPDVLCKVEARLQQQLHDLPLQQLCLGLFALGAAKHPADAAFMVAALERVDAESAGCRGLDVAHLLYSCATMSGWGGDLPQVLQQPEQRAQLHRLVYHAQQELEALDQASLAMLLWSLGKLQLQPPEAFLQAVMAATRQLMPSMSLVSVVSILEAFKALQYLPPLPWLLEVCAAARAKVTSDSSPKGWQRKKCVRRFEETVEWYNQAMQAAAQGGGSGNDESQQLDKQQQRQQARVGMLAAGSAGSEAVLAAAVGVAAAVAQQWHP